MYRWGIGDGSWSAAVSGGENSNSNASGESMTWDGGDEIYITRGSSELNRYNIATNTWTLSQDNLPASLEAGTELIYVNNYVNQIVVDNAGVTYWFFGDADHVTVITKDTLNKYWFSYFGMIDTFESDSKLITTASVSAGSNSVSYSGLLDFAIGDKLYIYEPTSNKAERITVSATGVNSLTATFVNGYGSGSKISFDPQPVVTYAGHWDSVIPVHGALGPATTSGLNNPYQFNYMQQLIPPRPEVLRSTSPTSRNRYMMWPILVGSWKSAETIGVSSYVTYYNAIDRITEKVLGTTDPSREIRGELMDVYVMKKTSSPLPVTGDKIVIGGKDYWIFECENLFEMEDWFIVIGPAE